MRILFEGTPPADDAADAFILAFLAGRKGNPVNARQVWKSLRSRGFVPTDGTPSLSKVDADVDSAAVAEILRRLRAWHDQGLIGGETDPETITEDRHFWVLGPLSRKL
ncbi:MAG: hypothetical protein ACYDFT_06035 [Thermoplasmata archaeon]